MSIREQYWRYSLIAIILVSGVVIFRELRPFLGGIMGAATIYMLLKGQQEYLTVRKRWRRSLAATLLLIEAILCFLVPLSLVTWMLVDRIQHIAIDPQSIIRPINHIAHLIEERTGYYPFEQRNINYLISLIPKAGQWVMSSIGNLGINMAVLLLVLYFMLIGGERMEHYFRDILPFNRTDSDNILHEIGMIVRSNAIGIPLLALIQGLAAYIGYVIFGAPTPLFWGVITCFATIIPLFGTGLVWLPLSLYMGLNGQWGAAIGLSIYSAVILSQIDNFVRLILQKKMADIHPLVTIFGVFIGLSLFGFMGIIFGPLLLSLFIFCVNLFKEHYLGSKPR